MSGGETSDTETFHSFEYKGDYSDISYSSSEYDTEEEDSDTEKERSETEEDFFNDIMTHETFEAEAVEYVQESWPKLLKNIETEDGMKWIYCIRNLSKMSHEHRNSQFLVHMFTNFLQLSKFLYANRKWEKDAFVFPVKSSKKGEGISYIIFSYSIKKGEIYKFRHFEDKNGYIKAFSSLKGEGGADASPAGSYYYIIPHPHKGKFSLQDPVRQNL